MEENSELAERLNWQSGEISRLRGALRELEAEEQGGMQRGGHGAVGGEEEDEEGEGGRGGGTVWELPDGVQLSEEELQLLALAEEVSLRLGRCAVHAARLRPTA